MLLFLSLPLHTLLQPQVLPRQGLLPPQALQPWTEQQSAISNTAIVNISSPTAIDQEDQTEPQAPTPAQTTQTKKKQHL
uniref:Uncharacterized protein n=1 Tax=Knipowitschia caucasica TaxID=637954 RepID=A0AAV2K5Y2_KNICA